MNKAFLLALLVLVSCTANETPRPLASPSGPPTIQDDAIEAHAEQFSDELPERKAGSEQEFAAATYITAHLQQAGYVVEFDSVPVANTVRSTNVVALPPSTQDPEYLVVVAYDATGTPASIGAFLELARALRAAVPEHSVEFAAIGAEAGGAEGTHLGTRRMVQTLVDRDLDPYVVELKDFSLEGGVHAVSGLDENGLADHFAPPQGMENPYGVADLKYMLVSGYGIDGAQILLEYLIRESG